ncbi:MAG: hypothetical protein EVB11_07765 [Winogradskyella sp.]|nr:MAG: hypothetical protein EVB11_07765 [Winogradskyella sp.]
MKPKTLLVLFIFLTLLSCINEEKNLIPVDTYKLEISNLKTEKEISAYWQKLYHLDQDILVGNLKIQSKRDSLSIANMIRTALMFETHRKESYKPNNLVPILNLAHNNINGSSSLAFWPIIQQTKEVGGAINSFGGKFPAYQLEALTYAFYDYSVFGQKSIYPKLLDKLNKKEYSRVSTSLIEIYSDFKALENLEIKKVIGTWQRKNFKDVTDASLGNFQIVQLSDNNIYIKRFNRLQLLNVYNVKPNSIIYKVENEPFHWSYNLSNNGDLSLLNDEGEILINYKKA